MRHKIRLLFSQLHNSDRKAGSGQSVKHIQKNPPSSPNSSLKNAQNASAFVRNAFFNTPLRTTSKPSLQSPSHLKNRPTRLIYRHFVCQCTQTLPKKKVEEKSKLYIFVFMCQNVSTCSVRAILYYHRKKHRVHLHTRPKSADRRREAGEVISSTECTALRVYKI